MTPPAKHKKIENTFCLIWRCPAVTTDSLPRKLPGRRRRLDGVLLFGSLITSGEGAILFRPAVHLCHKSTTLGRTLKFQFSRCPLLSRSNKSSSTCHASSTCDCHLSASTDALVQPSFALSYRCSVLHQGACPLRTVDHSEGVDVGCIIRHEQAHLISQHVLKL
jgi:hypothetical protein